MAMRGARAAVRAAADDRPAAAWAFDRELNALCVERFPRDTAFRDVGRRGRAYWGAYGTACAALEGFARILADELAAATVDALTADRIFHRPESRPALTYAELHPLPEPDALLAGDAPARFAEPWRRARADRFQA